MYIVNMTTTAAEIQALVRQLRTITAASPDAWTDVDLTFTQLRALFVLATQQPVRVSDLADALGMSLASASALNERLVRLGYVTRQRGAHDQRTVLLVLAPEGTHLLDRLERRSTAQLTRTIRQMTEAERAALTTSLRAFLRLAPQRSARSAPRVRGSRSA
jgi:DNA-binding MarR family transcriptional regulator